MAEKQQPEVKEYDVSVEEFVDTASLEDIIKDAPVYYPPGSEPKTEEAQADPEKPSEEKVPEKTDDKVAETEVKST